MTITVVALEDWMMAVIPRPDKTRFIGFEVIHGRKIVLSLSPEIFWRPELIIYIPYRRRPRAPSRVQICSIINLT
jgi:hypothetical protein